MSITEKIRKMYKNVIKNIKNMPNGEEKDKAIGSLAVDLGERCISALARELNCCREKIYKSIYIFRYGKPITRETRG